MAAPEAFPPGSPDFVSFLPDVVWYLTADGQDMWCRRPYAFFFSSAEAASRFAVAMDTRFPLVPTGIASKELVSGDGVAALRALLVTRVFLDPEIDPATGDVFGKILRFEDVQ